MRMNNEKIRIFFHSRIVYSCILLFLSNTTKLLHVEHTPEINIV